MSNAKVITESELLILRDNAARLTAMLPLFEEARDALCAITLETAKLRGLRLDLADRMDDVGIPDRWRKHPASVKDGGFHDDKPSETACNMAVTTSDGDLDPFGRPLRQGR